MVARFLVEARLGPFSLPRVIVTRPTMRKIRRGNAVWEGWRLATEPTIEPDVYKPTPCALESPPDIRSGRSGPSASLQVLRLPLPHLVGEEVEGQRAWRFVGIDVLAVRLTAPDEELALPAEHGSPAQRDRDGFRDDITAK